MYKVRSLWLNDIHCCNKFDKQPNQVLSQPPYIPKTPPPYLLLLAHLQRTSQSGNSSDSALSWCHCTHYSVYMDGIPSYLFLILICPSRMSSGLTSLWFQSTHMPLIMILDWLFYIIVSLPHPNRQVLWEQKHFTFSCFPNCVERFIINLTLLPPKK